jgi:hypothetical protein
LKEYIDLYIKNKGKIENFIENSIESLGKLENQSDDFYKQLFLTFPSLELIYIVDAKTNIQISPNIYKKNSDNDEKNKDRSYLINKLTIKNNGFAFTKPYQSSTGTLCITVSKKDGDNIIFLDFDLEKLLERVGIIEKHIYFSKIIKSFYFIAGFFMMILSISTIIYGGYNFINHFIQGSDINIDGIFKPVIATTLGLAIFDLAKTILEQEVFFKSYSKESKLEIKVLTKFLVTILIALSIETLIIVFKISIHNYEKMINALYLMGGVSFIILSLAVLIFLTKSKEE